MSQSYRIGIRILPSDPFWVQVRESAIQRAQQLGISTVPVVFDVNDVAGSAAADLLEELRAQELEVLISNRLPRPLARYLLEAGLALIYAEETNFRHARLTAPEELFTAAQMAAEYLVEACQGCGRILMICSDDEQLPTAVSRVTGFMATVSNYAQIIVNRLSTPWRYDEACEALRTQLAADNPPFDPSQPMAAIFGLSDPLALAAQDVGREFGFVDDRTQIAGINGDPLALAAILGGTFHATVETAATDLGHKIIDQACRAAEGITLPASFPYKLRLVTRSNVAEVAAEKLVAIADLPSRLVDVNRRQEIQRVRQVETSLVINQRSGAVLDGTASIHELADLIRVSYGFDDVRLFLWRSQDQTLNLHVPPVGNITAQTIPLAESAVLGQALLQNRPVYIPDVERSQRFSPDPAWPDMRSRVILPIRQGQRTLGVLDLQSKSRFGRNQTELDALQSLADQLGSTIQNAQLLANALAAKGAAEQASQMKTRLLANVSHELRTPLNVILGYTSAALDDPNPYGVQLPSSLRKDLHRIVVSSEHLVRLINDLLDLAHAESGTLSVFPEPIEPHGFLTDLFESVAATLRDGDDVHWQLQLPDSLPPIMADPVRLRQILLNLLSNAAKFTRHGRIALGASAGPSELHIWVEDTGRGIPSELLSHIFEAFVTAESTSSPTDRTREGVGMGLSVAHQLVSLHGGTLKIDSLLGYGTTCHLYWPMPLERGAEMQPVRSTSPSNEPLSTLLDELIDNAGELVQRTAAYIHSHFATEISRRELADAVGVSPNYVTRIFRRETGLTPWQYLNRYRVAQAQRLLRESDISVTEIAAQVGFNDAAYFSRIFRRESGQPPALFRNQIN